MLKSLPGVEQRHVAGRGQGIGEPVVEIQSGVASALQARSNSARVHPNRPIGTKAVPAHAIGATMIVTAPAMA